MKPHNSERRKFFRFSLGGITALFLSGCDRINDTEWAPKLLAVGESLSKGVHKALVSRKSMAQEFTEADLSPHFRSNGTSNPDNAAYQELAKNNFDAWTLTVDGLIATPTQFSL